MTFDEFHDLVHKEYPMLIPNKEQFDRPCLYISKEDIIHLNDNEFCMNQLCWLYDTGIFSPGFYLDTYDVIDAFVLLVDFIKRNLLPMTDYIFVTKYHRFERNKHL